jgi:multiple sugar transport system substrate-binding protein
MITLRALGWDHPRCMPPMRACATRWAKTNPSIHVQWDTRSLWSFGDQPLREVAAGYDLVVIDHPSVGEAEQDGVLTPINELLSRERLDRLAAETVGPSHRSYELHGSHWAVATDAACQVGAFRPDLCQETPGTWAELLEMARAAPGAIGLPLAPAHALCSWMTLVANAGSDPFEDIGAGIAATELLLELARLGPPEAFDWEPPGALARLTSADDLAVIPLTFGYSRYATDAVQRPCRFGDIPSAGNGPVGAVLGGAGIAITATSEHPTEAAAFAAWVGGREAQCEAVAPEGGQPAHPDAWGDPELDRLAGGLYSGTRAVIDSAWVRPRERWYPSLQRAAGDLLTEGLRRGASAEALTVGIHELHQRHSALHRKDSPNGKHS